MIYKGQNGVQKLLASAKTTYSLVISAERRAWSTSFRMPFGLSMASLAKSTSLGTPRRVPVVLKTFRRSESGPRRKDWTKKKTIEQNKILRLLSTLGGNGFGGGRVRYAVFKALR